MMILPIYIEVADGDASTVNHEHLRIERLLRDLGGYCFIEAKPIHNTTLEQIDRELKRQKKI